MSNSFRFHCACICFLSFFFLSATASSLLVSYGPAAGYVSADAGLSRTAVRSGSGPYLDVNGYSDTVPLSPSSGYEGAVFYGGYQFSSSTLDGGFTKEMVRNDYSSMDQIYLQAWRSGGWPESTLSLHGIYLFKQEDFTAGLDVGFVVLDGLFVQVSGYGNSSGTQAYDAEGRFVVQIGSTVYVSQTTFDFSANGSFSLSGASLTNELWAPYDPSNELNFDQAVAVFSSQDLAGISAVGIYFEDDVWSGTDAATTAFGLGIASFEATGSLLVVEYGPDTSYVASDVNFQRTAVRLGSGPFVDCNGYDDEVLLSPDSNYSGPTFFGGYEFVSSTLDGGFTKEMIRNDYSSSDQIYLQAWRSGGWPQSTLSLHGIYLFQQNGFISGVETGSVAVDQLSVQWSGYGNDSGTLAYDATGRFAVQVGTGVYVSQTTFDCSQSGSITLDGTNLLNELWAVYEPRENLNFDQSSATFATLDLVGVRAAGVYFEDDEWLGTDAATTAFGLGIASFEVAGSVVPEWSTSLYDASWSATPSLSFETNKMIQDFSYAGYDKGESLLPTRDGAQVLNVTSYGADTNGVIDSTSAIQAAIDAAAAISGGAVVYLPEGTYRVSPVAGRSRSLLISKSNVVLRGAGADKTRILNHSTDMRGKSILLVTAPAAAKWDTSESPETLITADLMSPTFTIPVASVFGFQVGDQIIVRADPTDEWLADHNEEAGWSDYQDEIGSFRYHRTITAIDSTAKTLTIDIPTRYMLKKNYDARVYLKTGMLSGVGLEGFSIGNIEHSGTNGWGTMDFDDSSKSAYDIHYSFAITFVNVMNGWIKGVESFKTDSNLTGCHLLSNAIRLKECRNVSVVDCVMQKTQYGGGGGNGYMFRMDDCNECFFERCTAAWARHGFSINGMSCSGNVLYKCFDKETGHQTGANGHEHTTGKSSDHHMWFSHSNLYDGCMAQNSWFEARDRYYDVMSEPKHNSTSAHSVIWNTECWVNSYQPFAVWSMQARYGYIIGTRGAVTAVRTDGYYSERTVISDPVDHVEGVGLGSALVPSSLYEDQWLRRMVP